MNSRILPRKLKHSLANLSASLDSPSKALTQTAHHRTSQFGKKVLKSKNGPDPQTFLEQNHLLQNLSTDLGILVISKHALTVDPLNRRLGEVPVRLH